MHAGNVILNTGVVFLFGAFGHWTSGILNGVGGAIVGEAIIYTEPIDQIEDLARYRKGDLGAAPQPHAWLLAPAMCGTGLTLSMAF